MTDDRHGTVLVTGGTGKTGRRVAARLGARGVPVRIGSRAHPTHPFDWDDPKSWAPALDGIAAAWVAYAPDLETTGADERIGAFALAAAAAGVGRLVMISGRGEPGAARCEAALKRSGVAWTVIQSSFFMQNFDEGAFSDYVRAGEVALPAGEVGEPFVDADDVAEVAVRALTDPAFAGRTVEMTGPRLLTFREAVAEIAAAARRPIRYRDISLKAFRRDLAAAGLPEDLSAAIVGVFASVLDGRNAHLAPDAEAVLGRPPTDFSAYARRVAWPGARFAAAS